MTPILPPEILANVVYQVFNHCRHLNTLYTLLFTSKSLFNEATRVLYYDPFKSSQLALHNPALIDLVRFLFSVSPLEDEINEVRVLLDIPRIKNPMANYLDLILSDKMQLNDAYSYFSPAMLSEYWGVEGSKAEDLYRCQKIQASLAWTVYGGRLSRFKQIHFPWCGIELLSSHVDQMSRLQILHVHSDNSYSRDSSKSQESLENVVRLVKKMHVIHSPNQLKDIRWSSRHDVRMRCSLVIRELESLLPPLIQPLFFDYSKHWRSFWAHDLAEVDFSRVEDVELPSADQKPIDLHSVDQLQRFRNMKSLTKRYL
ncbi:hypothetical protein BGZ73_004097 [Actinomortierella ambigua]|nr:hypothetical protein BGZ73_004097 [Actinomortierella ambigua]